MIFRVLILLCARVEEILCASLRREGNTPRPLRIEEVIDRMGELDLYEGNSIRLSRLKRKLVRFFRVSRKPRSVYAPRVLKSRIERRSHTRKIRNGNKGHFRFGNER